MTPRPPHPRPRRQRQEGQTGTTSSLPTRPRCASWHDRSLAPCTASACCNHAGVGSLSQALCTGINHPCRCSTATDAPERGKRFRRRRATAQERAAAVARMAEPPDVVPRWHRSNSIIGAGPAGYVYQVYSRIARNATSRPLRPAAGDVHRARCPWSGPGSRPEARGCNTPLCSTQM